MMKLKYYLMLVTSLALVISGGFINISYTRANATGTTRIKQNKESTPNFNIFANIERQLGKPLTPVQRREIARIGQQTLKEVLTTQDKFEKELSQITTLGVGSLQELMPNVLYQNNPIPDNLVQLIEKKLGRNLSAEQKNKVNKLIAQRKATLIPLQKNFIQRVAQITGLSREQVAKILP